MAVDTFPVPTSERGPSGRFQPGNRAAVNNRSRSLMKRVEPSVPAVVARLIEIAKGDDAGPAVAAAKTLLDRYAGIARPEETTLPQLPEVTAAATISDKALAIASAVSEGRISVEQGAKALTLLADVAKIIEVDALEARVRRIEGRVANQADMRPRTIEMEQPWD